VDIFIFTVAPNEIRQALEVHYGSLGFHGAQFGDWAARTQIYIHSVFPIIVAGRKMYDFVNMQLILYSAKFCPSESHSNYEFI